MTLPFFGFWRKEYGWVAAAVIIGLLLAILPIDISLLLLIGVGGSLLLLLYPLAGLALTLLLGPLGAVERQWVNLGPIDSGQFMLAITVGVWLLHGAAKRKIVIPRSPLTLPLLLFIGITLLTILDAPSLQFGLLEVVKWVEVWLVMLLVTALGTKEDGTTDKKAIYKIVSILLFAGIVQAAIGAWQYGIRGDGPEHFLINGTFYRAYGSFEQPNPYGGFMHLNGTLAAGAIFGLLIHLLQQLWPAASLRELKETVRLQANSFAWLIWFGGCGLMLVAGLLFSWSRGAWLGFAAGLGVMALFIPKRRWQGIGVVLCLLLVLLIGIEAGIVPATVSERLTSWTSDFRFGDVRGVDVNDANFAVIERLAHWQAAITMASNELWLGVGFGNYEPAYAPVALLNWPHPLGHAHNYYLNILAETGVVGFSMYLILWGVIVWQTIGATGRLTYPLRGIALGLLAAWGALSTHHLLDKLYVNNLYIHIGVMLGVLQLLLIYVRQQSNDACIRGRNNS